MGQFEMAHPLNSVDLYKSFQIMQEIRHQTARKSSKQQSIELPPMQTRSSGTLSKRKQLTSIVKIFLYFKIDFLGSRGTNCYSKMDSSKKFS